MNIRACSVCRLKKILSASNRTRIKQLTLEFLKTGTNRVVWGNVPNKNLPSDSCVEVPCLVHK
ncbi:hypothetical protein [Fictibacillus enclensis]|uniref:family 4 glycosyl hydrolase n=1 Tax=Fictibacillus enclensis TaxID=1017270 RepID=UPI00333A0D2D